MLVLFRPPAPMPATYQQMPIPVRHAGNPVINIHGYHPYSARHASHLAQQQAVISTRDEPATVVIGVLQQSLISLFSKNNKKQNNFRF